MSEKSSWHTQTVYLSAGEMFYVQLCRLPEDTQFLEVGALGIPDGCTVNVFLLTEEATFPNPLLVGALLGQGEEELVSLDIPLWEFSRYCGSCILTLQPSHTVSHGRIFARAHDSVSVEEEIEEASLGGALLPQGNE